MSEYLYRIREDNVDDGEGGKFTAFGIEAVDCVSKKVTESIPDLFFEKKSALDFAALCNSEDVDLKHIYDIAEDLLD